MVEVEVRNFQSIEHATIKVDGFTALVGRSNIGKSALVRAVKAALTGASGTSFVRHGSACLRRTKNLKTCECFTTVHIRTEGFDLLWKKGDKHNQYVFNGQTYDRTEQGTPDFLLRPQLAQDFGTVDVARKAKLLQVADQFDNVFLLDQTGGTVADVLSDVARLDRVNVAIRMVEKDRRDAASSRKVYEKEIVDLTARVAAFEGLEGAVEAAAAVETKLGEITKVQKDAQALTSYIKDMETLGFRVDALQKACDITVPDPNPIVGKQNSLTQLLRFLAQAGEKATVIRALSGVESISEPDLMPVSKRAEVFNCLSGWISRLRVFQDAFNKAKPVEAVVVPETSNLTAARDRFVQLQSFITKSEALQLKVEELQLSLDAIEDEEALVKDDLNALGVCPTCIQPVTPEHLHRSVA